VSWRIAFAVHDARPGGGQDRYALELVNGLSARHHVTLFARTATGLAQGVHLVRIETPNRPGLLRAGFFAARVARMIHRSSYDIVHTIGGAVPGASVITAQFCQAAWRVAQRRWPPEFQGRAERLYRVAETLVAARNERRAATSGALRALIAVSRSTRTEWLDAYGAAPRVRPVIPNAVDAARFALPAETRATVRRALEIPDGATVALIVGALVRKGIATAIEALAGLDANVYLVAVGAGPHDRIRAFAARHGVTARLRLLPPAPDVERYFAAADAFLFPTRYEPFGMVIAEAWAAGLPVVCAAAAGALEWARDGHEALIVADPADAPSFATALRQVREDPALATRLAEGGRALARQFTWDRVVRETEEAYRGALA
jgi:UDP-glucose:(heptosyl)LPS alpha-1,3-glucosyltransferase